MGDNGSGTPPRPKSPPEYPDVSGKHRLKVAVQSLNHEIDYLERELNSMEKTVPASRCCKELNEYVSKNPDPLIKVYEKQRKKSCCVWDIFRAIVCCSWSGICCTRGCLCCFSQPKRCCLQLKDIVCCQCCHKGVRCAGCNCCKISSCNLESPCPECSFRCVCSCSRCAKSCGSPICTGCCKGCCLC